MVEEVEIVNGVSMNISANKIILSGYNGCTVRLHECCMFGHS